MKTSGGFGCHGNDMKLRNKVVIILFLFFSSFVCSFWSDEECVRKVVPKELENNNDFYNQIVMVRSGCKGHLENLSDVLCFALL